jgi:hypothetical protein
LLLASHPLVFLDRTSAPATDSEGIAFLPGYVQPNKTLLTHPRLVFCQQTFFNISIQTYHWCWRPMLPFISYHCLSDSPTLPGPSPTTRPHPTAQLSTSPAPWEHTCLHLLTNHTYNNFPTNSIPRATLVASLSNLYAKNNTGRSPNSHPSPQSSP